MESQGPRREFYFDPTTGEVVEGKRRGWTRRMGPYASKEAAEAAFEIARVRNAVWEAEDEAERERDEW